MSNTMENLRTKIIAANEAYWQKHESIMDDAEYDRCIEELRKMAPKDPLVNMIGGSTGECVHPYPMLSLAKAYSKEEVVAWMNKVARNKDEQFLVSPKLDGCTCRVTDYRMYTRGNGVKGEEITKVHPIVKFVTNNTGSDDLGEMIITNSDFEKYCESGEYTKQDGSIYQNSRNAVAGILGRTDIDPTDPRVLTMVSYDSIQAPCVIGDVERRFGDMVDSICADYSDYPMDGIVFKLADEEYAKSLGNTDHHPHGAIAYKFKNVSEITTIRNIQWQPGKEYITPVAIVDKININGSNITQVTLHNWRNVHVNDIQINDKLVIERAGDVIPKVVQVISGGNRLGSNEPTHCEFCGSELKQTDVELYCPNPDCKGKILQRLEAACKILKLDGFGPVVLNTLYDNKIVTDLVSLFRLPQCSVKYYCGLGEVTIDNLCTQVSQLVSRGVNEADLLAALCIPTIGPVVAKQIVRSVSLERLILEKDAINEVQITPAKLKELTKWFTVERRAELVKLLMVVTVMRDTFDELVCKICFTGTMSVPRKTLEEMAEQKGYTAVQTVTRDLNLLVVPDLKHQSSKVSNAKKFGIRIITEQEFYEIK